ncbi:flagellar type III secretion system protein FlhB [Buchnera aphidicola (Formosaphis micheliae)]|uniref:flagellar type III secretion system protein FlhB n=1 Tax=Buchnera aphidicola TaxID=9 RepID=UPI0031CC7576
MNDDKTENPTHYRYKKIYKTGKIRYSQELSSFIILSIGFIFLWFYKDIIIQKIFTMFLYSFRFDHSMINNVNFINVETNDLIFIIFYFLILIFIPTLITVLVSKFFGGIAFNFLSFKFNLGVFNPLKGFKKIFSYQTLLMLIKISIKIFLMLSITIFFFLTYTDKILTLIHYTPKIALKIGYNIIEKFCFLFLGIFFIVVVFDIFLENYGYKKQFKMSRKEVKDELKQMEGDPYVKRRIRQAMKTLAHRRMFSDIKKADVIIINPVHYSIALSYDKKNMNAPKILAKGAGELANKIRYTGKKYLIPIITAPILARYLYFHTQVGQYIPSSLYKVISEVLAWVWKLRIWKEHGGIYPQPPENLLIPSNLNNWNKDNIND